MLFETYLIGLALLQACNPPITELPDPNFIETSPMTSPCPASAYASSAIPFDVWLANRKRAQGVVE